MLSNEEVEAVGVLRRRFLPGIECVFEQEDLSQKIGQYLWSEHDFPHGFPPQEKIRVQEYSEALLETAPLFRIETTAALHGILENQLKNFQLNHRFWDDARARNDEIFTTMLPGLRQNRNTDTLEEINKKVHELNDLTTLVSRFEEINIDLWHLTDTVDETPFHSIDTGPLRGALGFAHRFHGPESTEVVRIAARAIEKFENVLKVVKSENDISDATAVHLNDFNARLVAIDGSSFDTWRALNEHASGKQAKTPK